MWARVFALFVMIFAFAAPAHAQDGRWLRAESDNFIVYGLTGEAQLRSAVQMLEDFDQTLRIITGATATPSESKLEIYLVRRLHDLRQVRPGIGDGIAGFYLAGDEQIAAFSIYSSEVFDRNTILLHEYAHHFMLHYFPDAYPRWYIEGFAEYVSTVEFRGRRVSVGRPSEWRGDSLVGSGILPVEVLLAPERRRGERIYADFYANAWFATTFIFNRNLQPNLHRYVDALGMGEDPIEAFEPAFGMTPETFRTQLTDFRGQPINVLSFNLPNEPGEITITRLPRSADGLLLPLARMRAGVPEDEVEALAAEIETEAARFPDDAYANLARARVFLLRKQYIDAQETLEQLLNAQPAHAEARYLLASSILHAAEGGDQYDLEGAVAQARRELVRGFRDNPTYFPTLYLYATTYANESGPMEEAQLNVLARALELGPQADQVRLTFARELIEAGRYVPAVIALRPLIYAPHGGEIAEQARALFDFAREHTSAAP